MDNARKVVKDDAQKPRNLLSEIENRTYKIVCSDGAVFVVKPVIMDQLGTLNKCIGAAENSAGSLEVPVPNVDGNTMKLVIEYCEHHRNDISWAPRDLSSWDNSFFDKLKQSELVAVILAANYLDAKGLFDRITTFTAQVLGKSSLHDAQELFNPF